MTSLPLITIRVILFDGTPVKDVKFSYRESGSQKYIALTGNYSANSGVYTFLLIDYKTGLHFIRIEASGFETIEKKAQFREAGYGTDVILVEPGTECIKQGGRRVYFKRKPDVVGVHFPKVGKKEKTKRDKNTEKKLKAFDKNILSDDNQRIIFKEEQDGVKKKKKSQKLFDKLKEEFPEALISDQAIEVHNGTEEFLSSKINLQLNLGVTWEDIKRKYDIRGIDGVYNDPYNPSFYQLHVADTEDYKVLSIIDQISQSPDVILCEPVILKLASTTAPVLPPDFLRPWQWHLNVLNMPKAWELLDGLKDVNNVSLNLKFGSADVILSVHDDGIETNVLGIIQHPDMLVPLVGGKLTAYLGNASKVYHIYNLDGCAANANLMGPYDNTNFNTPPHVGHGVWVSGVATAGSGVGNEIGTVGVAPNVRLGSYVWNNIGDHTIWAHHFLYMSGFDPFWFPGGAPGVIKYQAAQTFPTLFETGSNTRPGSNSNPGPAAFIINCSHTQPNAISQPLQDSFRRITMLGRNRRGVVFIVTSDNLDADTQNAAKWGNEVNAIKVAASSLDHKGIEIVSCYSSFDSGADQRRVDFCAPTSSNVIARHNPPSFLKVVTDERLGGAAANNLPGTTTPPQGTALNALPPTTNFITFSPADFLNFNVNGTEILIVDPVNSENVEHNTIVVPAPFVVPANSVALTTPIDSNFPANAFVRTGPLNYTDSFGGTSAAAPMVSGVVALMLSVNPKLTWSEVHSVLKETAIPVSIRFQGQNRDKRWFDAANNDIIDVNGVMNLPPVPPVSTITVALNKGATLINVTNGAAYSVKQAITIGAEARLTGIPAVNQITVSRGNDFEKGDTIHIGKTCESILDNPSIAGGPPGTAILVVVNSDGFAAGDALLVGVGPGAQQVTVNGIINPFAPGSTSARVGIAVTAVLPAFVPVPTGTLVKIDPAVQYEGPFTITAKAGNVLTLNANVVQAHAVNSIVQKQNTEVAVIKKIVGNQLEVYPLINTHLLNNNPVVGPPNLHITGGLIVDHSNGFGYGRIDAYEAVKLAGAKKVDAGYKHDERDIMIRNFIGDDGETNRSAKLVHSPDLWVTNNNASPAGLNYNTEGPHEIPRTEFSAPLFVGAGPLDDLSITGAFGGGVVANYVIEITLQAANDQFTWTKDGGAPSAPIAIAPGGNVIDAAGGNFTIVFNAVTGHGLNDKWSFRAEPIANRHVHLRFRNRGSLPLLLDSAVNAPNLPTPVNLYRIFLCLTDGSPVVKYNANPAGGGINDLTVVSDYTGAAKDIITISIDAVAPDSFKWSKGAGVMSASIPIVAGPIAIINGVSIQFTNLVGHAVGDIWVLKCYPEAQKFINIDNYIEYNPVGLPAFNLNANRTGTWLMNPGANPLQPMPEGTVFNGLANGADNYFSVAWPEANRPLRNEFGVAQPARPLRMFILGEVTPHDGPLMDDGTQIIDPAQLDNNISYREIIFADFAFRDQTGAAALISSVEVDNFGTPVATNFKIYLRSNVSTFETNKTKLKFILTSSSGVETTAEFSYDGVNWVFTGDNSNLFSANPPVVANTGAVAAGEQYQVAFTGSFSLAKFHQKLVIKAEITSSVNAGVVLADSSHNINVAIDVPAPFGFENEPPEEEPISFVFADINALNVQGAALAFGPNPADPNNLFRVTNSFIAPGPVNAYAVTDGIVFIQKVDANRVNLILKPITQPGLFFTPVKYYVYRGLRLDNFLDVADETKVVANSSISPFIFNQYAIHNDLNPPGTDFLSKSLGHDPANQNGVDLLDTYFFRQDAAFQYPIVKRGEQLGLFYVAGGTFGLDIVLEEGTFQPTLDYARLQYYEIDVSLIGDALTKRFKQDEILNFLDVAAYYGMHATGEGKVKLPANVEHQLSSDIYLNVLIKFANRNKLFLDVRSENGDSYNFYRNYNGPVGDADLGKQIQIGTISGTLSAQKYQFSPTAEWPFITVDTPQSHGDPDNSFFLTLRIDDNLKPLLYADRGFLTTPSINFRFVEGVFLHPGTLAPSWTVEQGFKFPNFDDGTNKLNIATVIRLIYARQLDAATVFPVSVVQTKKYNDNLFGPVSLDPLWTSAANTKWLSAQDKKYVDGGPAGFAQIVERGIGFDGVSTIGERAIYYASATDKFKNLATGFQERHGITSGTSEVGDFFDVSVFKGYALNFDCIVEGAVKVGILNLNSQGRPTEDMFVLGITKTQLTALKGIGGLSTIYPRHLFLVDLGLQVDDNGRSFNKYEVKVSGLKTDDTYGTVPTASSGVFVYSLDNFFFNSKEFADLQALPTTYSNNFEEQLIGAAKHPTRNGLKVIETDQGNGWFIMDPAEIGQQDVLSWKEKITVTGSTAMPSNNGLYTVKDTFELFFVNLNANVRVIEVVEPIPSGVTNDGSVVAYTTINWEDYFMALDDKPTTVPHPDIVPTIVANFSAAINAVAGNDPTAESQLLAHVETYSEQLFKRVCHISQLNTYGEADDRILYWARLQMLVDLKGHAFLLGCAPAKFALIRRLEDISRGFTTATFTGAPPGAKKVLITGFDPFHMQIKTDINAANANTIQGNPSGANALALHGTQFTNANGDVIYVQAMIFPNRYEDFDLFGGEGVVERATRRFVDPADVDYEAVDMVMTISQGGPHEFWVDRFAGRVRGGGSDNNNKSNALFPSNPVGLPFYETNLPYQKIVPAINGDISTFRIYYNNNFTYEYPVEGGKTTVRFTQSNSDCNNLLLPVVVAVPETDFSDGLNKIEDVAHPQHNSWMTSPLFFSNEVNGWQYGLTPAELSEGTEPKRSQITCLDGSGGTYFSNEIHYRVARLRAETNPTLMNGHYHIPIIQASKGLVDYLKKELGFDIENDYRPAKMKALIDVIVESLKKSFMP